MSTWTHDPHEPAKRIDIDAKSDSIEAYFVAANEALRDARLPPPPFLAGVDKRPMLCIVGAHKIAKTLLHQLLARHLPLGYVSNLAARFWNRPGLGMALTRELLTQGNRDEILLKARHGASFGLAGPHEFAYFWRQWLRLDESPTHKLREETIATIDQSALRKVLHQEILGHWEFGMLFKQDSLGFNTGLLNNVHPGSIFLFVHRNPLDATRAMLRLQKQRYGSYDAWHGLKPARYEKIRKIDCAAKRTLLQMIACNDEVERSLKESGAARVDLQYEDICDSPRKVLETVCDRLAKIGFDLKILGEPPHSISRNPPAELPPNLETRLLAAAREMNVAS